MCGIFALSRASRSSIPSGRRFAIAGVTAIESRGRHATGFGWADEQGWPWFWKQQGAASVVAKHADLPASGLRTLVGHTRHATVGSPSNNDNNHPVHADGLVLVHNGRVDNAADLTALSGADPIAEVDSESLALLLAADLGADHPVELLELVEGVAAIAWIDGYEPGVLHLARLSTRPLTVGWTRKGDFVASSTRHSLRETARLSGVRIEGVDDIAEGVYLRVEAGVITEYRKFVPRHPKAIVPEDVPANRRRSTSTPVRAGARNSVAATEIDWANLVPRRGWA